MTATPKIRYYLTLPGKSTPTVLETPDVIPWVKGYAAAMSLGHLLDVVDTSAAEDTVRVQMLQVGDQLGWFRYMYQKRDDDTRDDTATGEDA